LSRCVSRICQTSPSTQCRVHPHLETAPVGRIRRFRNLCLSALKGPRPKDDGVGVPRARLPSNTHQPLPSLWRTGASSIVMVRIVVEALALRSARSASPAAGWRPDSSTSWRWVNLLFLVRCRRWVGSARGLRRRGSDPLSTPLSSRLSSSEFDDAVLRVALTYELFGLTLALEVQQDTGYRANGLPPPNRVELLVRRTMNFASLGHLGLS